MLAPYDEITDLKTAELQEKMLFQLHTWESLYHLNPDSTVLSYQKNLQFYNEVKTVLDVLQYRNEGIDKNRIVTEHLMRLRANVLDMEDMHREDDILSAADLQSFRTIFNVQLGAIQRFQQTRRTSKK